MEFPEGIREGDAPVPWALKLVYLIVASWCLWYLGTSLRSHGVSAVTSVEIQASVR